MNWKPVGKLKDLPHQTLLMLKNPDNTQRGVGILEFIHNLEIWTQFVIEKNGQLYMSKEPDDMTGWSYQIYPD